MMGIVQEVSARIKGSVMRRSLVVALCLLGFVAQANAQDFETPTLRGTTPFIPAAPTYHRWAGFYVGGHAAYGASGMDFRNATSDLVAFILRQTTIEEEFGVSNWPLLSKSTVGAFGGGAFAGYNIQFDNTIVGIDATYTRMKLAGSSTDAIARQFTTSNDYNNVVDITGTAALTIKDIFTVRGRAGVTFGQFLAYATLGAAFGIADYSRSVTVITSGTYVGDPPALPDYGPTFDTTSSVKKNMFIYGYAAGLGMDVAIFPNAFLRGEWEFIQFTGPQNVDAYVSMVRGGMGLKF
jgi:opacity protein-like surface antigen